MRREDTVENQKCDKNPNKDEHPHFLGAVRGWNRDRVLGKDAEVEFRRKGVDRILVFIAAHTQICEISIFIRYRYISLLDFF